MLIMPKKVSYFTDNDERNNPDPYVYRGTEVLKNILDIRNREKLRQVEAKIFMDQSKLIDPAIFGGLSAHTLKQVHAFLFGGLYQWAGSYRLIPVYKKEQFYIPGLSLEYTQPKDIAKKLAEIFREMDLEKGDFAENLATSMAKIWRVHPFREGNTRTILCFAKVISAKHRRKFDLDVFYDILTHKRDDKGNITSLSIRDLFVAATLDEAPETHLLIEKFRKALS